MKNITPESSTKEFNNLLSRCFGERPKKETTEEITERVFCNKKEELERGITITHVGKPKQVFLEACGIVREKIFKGSELQYWDSFDKECNDCNKGSKYRLKPDHSAEIAQLERQIEILKNK